MQIARVNLRSTTLCANWECEFAFTSFECKLKTWVCARQLYEQIGNMSLRSAALWANWEYEFAFIRFECKSKARDNKAQHQKADQPKLVRFLSTDWFPCHHGECGWHGWPGSSLGRYLIARGQGLRSPHLWWCRLRMGRQLSIGRGRSRKAWPSRSRSLAYLGQGW